MIDLQYYHSQKHKAMCPEFTAVVAVPSQERFLAILNKVLEGKADVMVFKVGVTEVIKGDQYNKRIGREKSQQRMQEIEYDMISVRLSNGVVHYTFSPTYKSMPTLVFELKQNRKRPYLIKVYP